MAYNIPELVEGALAVALIAIAISLIAIGLIAASISVSQNTMTDLKTNLAEQSQTIKSLTAQLDENSQLIKAQSDAINELKEQQNASLLQINSLENRVAELEQRINQPNPEPIPQPHYPTYGPCKQSQLDSNFTSTGHLANNILNTGLVAEWDFENNARDTSSHGNNGSVCGDVTFVDGKIGKGARFGGTNGVIQVPNNPTLNFGSAGSFTISFWMKSTQSGGGEGGYGLLVDHRRNNDGQYIGYSVEDNSGQIIGIVRDRIHEAHVYSTTKVNDGQFHHVVLVFDRNAPITKLYIDDKMEGSDISGVNNIDSDFDILIGGQAPPNTLVDYYNGILDQLRIYDRVLSDHEIQSLFHES